MLWLGKWLCKRGSGLFLRGAALVIFEGALDAGAEVDCVAEAHRELLGGVAAAREDAFGSVRGAADFRLEAAQLGDAPRNFPIAGKRVGWGFQCMESGWALDAAEENDFTPREPKDLTDEYANAEPS